MDGRLPERSLSHMLGRERGTATEWARVLKRLWYFRLPMVVGGKSAKENQSRDTVSPSFSVRGLQVVVAGSESLFLWARAIRVWW